MQQPFAPALSASGGGTLSGTVFGILTWLNQFGETIGSNEVSLTGLTNNQVAIALVEVPAAATSGRFYFSSVSGREEQYVVVAITGSNFVGTTGQQIFVGTPPYKPSAFLPDSDGDMVSVFEMYRWMNAGLARLGRAAGGILDQTGVAMPVGNAEVVIPGWWLKFNYIWHNGWLTLAAEQSYTWLQSPVTGIPGIATLWRNGAQQVLGTWPQPSTAPVITTLSAPMAAGDTAAVIVNGNGFTAPGMCSIDMENMSYSVSTATGLTGIIRGYSGTIAAPHLVGATVSQLIFRILGRRMPVPIAVGQAANTLDVPQGWDEVMDLYLAAKYKEIDGKTAEAKSLMADFDESANKLQNNQIPLENKQVGNMWPFGTDATTLADSQDVVFVN